MTYLAEARPMPARASLTYIAERHMRESWDKCYRNYVADMLWAPANGLQFKKTQRYSELESEAHANQAQAQKIVTKKSVKDLFMRRQSEPSGADILDELLNKW